MYTQIIINFFFTFFLFSIRNENAKPVNKRKKSTKFNTNYQIFRKESNLPSGTLLSLSSYFDIEYNSAESLTNKYKLFGTKSKRTINSLAPSKKYIMIEEFKDELRDLKNILNEIKKTGTIERTRNK